MNASYQQCLLKCRRLASVEGLHTSSIHSNRLTPPAAASQSVADQLIYASAIEMVCLLHDAESRSLVVNVASVSLLFNRCVQTRAQSMSKFLPCGLNVKNRCFVRVTLRSAGFSTGPPRQVAGARISV